MSLLTTLQSTANELGLNEITSVIGSSNATTRNLLALTYRVGKDLRSRFQFVEFEKIFPVTLVADQANYALPADFEKFVHDTHWSDDDSWPLQGPVSEREWMERKYGVVASGPRQRYQNRGVLDNQFYIDPTPGTGEAGQVLYYMYMSNQWFKPRDWVASTAYSTGEYAWYNGNIYTCDTGGTSGLTAPTHTTGSVSDGSLNWTYSSAAYLAFTKDTDEFHYDDELMSLQIQWRWLRRNGFSYRDIRQEADDLASRESARRRDATEVSIGRDRVPRLISAANIPDSGYGS